MGYLSDWAVGNFSDVHQKNDFYADFGNTFSPRGDAALLDRLDTEMSPAEVLALAGEAMGILKGSMAGVFVGFGFGAIQGGLFLPAVQRSGNFDRIVIAEIESDIIDGVRANQGRFACNIAHDDRVELVYGGKCGSGQSFGSG